MARSSLEIASDLDARIAALEAKQREKATGAGKKNEKLLHMREQLQVLDKQRAAKAAELQATRQEEAAEQARKQQPPPPPPPANKSSPDQTSRAATPSAAALPAARPAPAPALAPAPPPPPLAPSAASLARAARSSLRSCRARATCECPQQQCGARVSHG